jgi:hypothetical protein
MVMIAVAASVFFAWVMILVASDRGLTVLREEGREMDGRCWAFEVTPVVSTSDRGLGAVREEAREMDDRWAMMLVV